MFKRLANTPGNNAQSLVGLHPEELIALLELAWNLRQHAPNVSTGHPSRRSNTSGLAGQLPAPVLSPPDVSGQNPPPSQDFATVLRSNAFPHAVGVQGIRWDHLIYAYMIENTRIYEIFHRVVYEFLHGEKLGVPSEETHLWLRNTEQLFFRETFHGSITSLDSHIRPDLRATRRNAYQRLFGMDLNHGGENNQPYSYIRSDAANNDFVATFEELLREVWIGYINRDTSSGAKPTDDSKIHELTRKLRDMLTTRRLKGNLSREEFFSVAMMSWFHLTVDSNTLPIIVDLRADGASPEQRLFKIAQLVGVPAHGLSRHYFTIAEEISAVLILIESDAFPNANSVRAYYDPTAPNTLSATMNTIITHWSEITGRDIKAGKVSVK